MTLAVANGVATITLNRPEKLNAIDPAMLARLDAFVAVLDPDPAVRVVVLAAAGERAFSVGADVNAWPCVDTWVVRARADRASDALFLC